MLFVIRSHNRSLSLELGVFLYLSGSWVNKQKSILFENGSVQGLD